MATESRPEAPATARALKLYRLNVRQFEAMIDAGVFAKGTNVELLGGLLVNRMTINDPHSFAVSKFGQLLRGVLPEGWVLRAEESLRLGRSWRPQPDIAVARGTLEDFCGRTPRAADLAFVVEVADSSYAKDRGVMWRRYAASRVPIYWIFHLAGRLIEVHSDPTGRNESARYRRCQIFAEDAEVPVQIEGREVGRIAVRDLLPRTTPG